jgi:hypothetical protein
MAEKIAVGGHAGHQVAKFLAAFSIVLGAAELIWPSGFTNFLGLAGLETLIMIYGVREIIAGIGLFAMPRHRSAWAWFRAAGDVLDILTVLYAFAGPNPPTTNIVIALILLVGVTVIDVWCANSLRQQKAMAHESDAYRDRAGLPGSGPAAR